MSAPAIGTIINGYPVSATQVRLGGSVFIQLQGLTPAVGDTINGYTVWGARSQADGSFYVQTSWGGTWLQWPAQSGGAFVAYPLGGSQQSWSG